VEREGVVGEAGKVVVDRVGAECADVVNMIRPCGSQAF
jgi:hypothetical protein